MLKMNKQKKEEEKEDQQVVKYQFWLTFSNLKINPLTMKKKKESNYDL